MTPNSAWNQARPIKMAILFCGLLATSPGWAAQTVCTPSWSGTESTDTSLLQAAINSCSAAGTSALPGLVNLTANGSITSAQITSVKLASNIVINVANGFTLRGPDPADVGYTGTASSTPAPIISGSGVSNVTITGSGVIDGNGSGYWTIFNKGGSNTTQERQKLIKISGSNIKIGNNFDTSGKSAANVRFPTSSNSPAKALTIKNSPKEILAIESGSSNVTIDGVWIYAPTGRADLGTGSQKNVAPNTDGIDIIGTNTATVSNCLIDTGDDNIAIKSNSGSSKTTGVTINGCVFGGGHGLSIGGQEAAGVDTVNVSNVWFKGTDYGFRIKTDNSSKDSGITNKVTYQNACMLSVGEPLLFTYNYNGTASGGSSPTIENVTVNNLIATAASTAGVSAQLGAIEGLVDDLMNRNITVTATSITGSSAKPFTITYGTLTLGSSSTLATSVGTGGSLVKVTDTAPTVSCPSAITIPSQK